MKTAISVPDETFDRVERVAKRHGLNRSQFYAQAADRYAAELESRDLTEVINAAIGAAGGGDSSEFAAEAAAALFEAEDTW